MSENRKQLLVEAALGYATRGLSVFPCTWIEGGACSCHDPECDSPGKHPLTPQGLLDATTNPAEVRDFWKKFPKANIAIRTGAESGLAVVDIDDLTIAKSELEKLCPDYNFKLVPLQKTGKPHGWHLAFAYPGVHVKTATKFLPGMDSRGDGGYIMAAPSIHFSGKHYEWKLPLNGTMPQLPAALLSAINGPTANGTEDKPRFDSSIVWEGIPEGQRDENLFKYACQIRALNGPRDVAEKFILEAAARCKPPFAEREALKKVEQAYKYPSGEGRPETKAEPAKKHHFILVSAHDVMAAEDVEQSWLWDGILPDGGMGLLVAKPKVGKTTLAFNLAVAASRGHDFLGRKTQQGGVVYLALEEKKGEIKKKLKAAGITDEPLRFHFGSAPINAMAEVEPLLVETKAKLLVIDVLQKFCRLRDLNDYAIVTNALEPLMAAARKQACHILLTHHAGKADRPDGDDILGSTGLLGGVDTSIHIKKRDKRRTFFTIQRYGEDTPETVIELKDDGSLEATGSREEVEIREIEPLILTALKDSEPMAADALCEATEKRKALVLKALALLIEKQQVTKSGSGKKGDPYKYSVLPFPDTNGNSKTEFFSGDNHAESKEQCCSGDFGNFSTGGNSIGTAFSAPEIGQKNGQKSDAVDDDFVDADAPEMANEWQRIISEHAAKKGSPQ